MYLSPKFVDDRPVHSEIICLQRNRWKGTKQHWRI